jgi:Fic family protein
MLTSKQGEVAVTQKEQIKKFIEENPGKTAVEISAATGIKASNVSSVLIKGYNAGMFKRDKPEGAKGWLYSIG